MSTHSLHHMKSSTPPRITLPPDVNAQQSSDLIQPHSRWKLNKNKWALPWPMIYISHFILAVIFGVLALVFALRAHSLKDTPFWDLFPEFVTMVCTLTSTFIVQFIILPSFWRARAREMVHDGTFDFSSNNSAKKPTIVLELGCGDGKTSAIFARAIVERQRDLERMSGPSATLPLFVGYDRWLWWSRLPNSPLHYLYTLLKVGVPRERIIANRVDDHQPPITDNAHYSNGSPGVEGRSEDKRGEKKGKEPMALPYATDSISLIICNLGLSELAGYKQIKGLPSSTRKKELFRECVRVLEPGGRMIVVESKGVGGKATEGVHWRVRDMFRGPLETYKRLLVLEMQWPTENVRTRWHWGIHYLIGTKPA
jgi:SAM-dependent methyltransferase